MHEGRLRDGAALRAGFGGKWLACRVVDVALEEVMEVVGKTGCEDGVRRVGWWIAGLDGKGVNSGVADTLIAAGRAVGQLLCWGQTLAAACPTKRACLLLFECGQIGRRRTKVPIDLACRRALLETYISGKSLCQNAGEWSMATRILEMLSHLRPAVKCRLPGQLMRSTSQWTARAAGYPVVRFESF